MRRVGQWFFVVSVRCTFLLNNLNLILLLVSESTIFLLIVKTRTKPPKKIRPQFFSAIPEPRTVGLNFPLLVCLNLLLTLEVISVLLFLL